MADQTAVTPWNEDRVRIFWLFVAERHLMFLRRVYWRQPPPWTANRILESVYFTNVYRELDRGTRYVITDLLGTVPGDPVGPGPFQTQTDILWNVLLYRMFNRIETHRALLGAGMHSAADWNGKLAERLLEKRKADGHQVFTGAFLVSNWGRVGSKIQLVTENLTNLNRKLPDLLDRILTAPSLERVHAELSLEWGIAGFMAYEIAIDLCYPGGLLSFDENDWVHPGPGAIDGLRILTKHGTKIGKKGGAELIKELLYRQREQQTAAGVWVYGPDLTLRNVEHSLCEFQKFWRAMQPKGRNKRLYRLERAKTDYTPWEPFPKAFVPPDTLHVEWNASVVYKRFPMR